MLEMFKSREIKENTLFIYYDDKTNCYGPNDLSLGKWFYQNNKRVFLLVIRDYILEVAAKALAKNSKVLEKYNSSEDYLLNRKIYLKKDKQDAIDELLELINSLNKNLNQETFDKISLLLSKFDLNIEFYFYNNLQAALELVKEHNRPIYRINLYKTFNEDNTLNFIEIGRDLEEEYLRKEYYVRFYNREDYREIPTFYQYEPDHPFYKDLLIKALTNDRPITEEDIDEMVAKYPYDRNVIY